MTFWMLLGKFATLYLSLQYTTSLEFSTPIESYVFGGSKEQIYNSLSPDSRILVIKPKDTKIDTNLTVFTKEGTYNFWVKLDQSEKPHVYVRVNRGQKDMSYQVKLETKDYRILEGQKSILFENKTTKEINVNGEMIQSTSYFSKGSPLHINHERVLY